MFFFRHEEHVIGQEDPTLSLLCQSLTLAQILSFDSLSPNR